MRQIFDDGYDAKGFPLCNTSALHADFIYIHRFFCLLSFSFLFFFVCVRIAEYQLAHRIAHKIPPLFNSSTRAGSLLPCWID